MKAVFLSLLGLILMSNYTLYGQSSTNQLPVANQDFMQLIKENGLEFNLPAGFQPTAIQTDSKVPYHYAVKDTATGFEIRYFVNPYAKNGNASRSEDHTYNLFVATVLEASGTEFSELPRIDALPGHAIERDFHGNYGAMSAFEPQSEFGKGFGFCAARVIRKDQVGEIYIFWLFTDVEKQNTMLMKTFAALKFAHLPLTAASR